MPTQEYRHKAQALATPSKRMVVHLIKPDGTVDGVSVHDITALASAMNFRYLVEGRYLYITK